MSAYYNENELYAVEWLGAITTRNLIAPGTIDARSVVDVRPDDVRRATQAHFFAGIGGWSYALRLAGWRDEWPVWTGSCPCQPFSQAGKRRGVEDVRHLWPVWFDLIRECRPPIVFGEQVASPDGLRWLDVVSTDLESADYAVGAADLCAAGVGAPHIRQRLYFVAVAHEYECRQVGTVVRWGEEGGGEERVEQRPVRGRDGELAVAGEQRREGLNALLRERRQDEDMFEAARGGALGDTHRLVDADQPRLQGWRRGWNGSSEWIAGSASVVEGLDGKYRPVEPGTFPLAHGIPARVGRLRAYGNAIVPQVAATFVRAVMDVLG